MYNNPVRKAKTEIPDRAASMIRALLIVSITLLVGLPVLAQRGGGGHGGGGMHGLGGGMHGGSGGMHPALAVTSRAASIDHFTITFAFAISTAPCLRSHSAPQGSMAATLITEIPLITGIQVMIRSATTLQTLDTNPACPR